MPRPALAGVNTAFTENHDVLYLRLANGNVKRAATGAMTGVPLKVFDEDQLPEVDVGTYVGHLMRTSSTKQSLTQAADRVTVDIQNVDTLVGLSLNEVASSLAGSYAVFGRAYKTGGGLWLTTPFVYGEVDDVSTDQNNATITIVSDTAPNVSFLTNRPIQKSCPLAFKGTRCGYVGAETTCNKKRDDAGGCSGRNNVHRFGGFIADGELATPIIGTGFGDIHDPDYWIGSRGRYPDQDGGRFPQIY